MFLFYNKLHNDLCGQYSNTIAKSGNFVQAPINVTIFGCLNDSIAVHSYKKSLIASSFKNSYFRSFTATKVSLHLAL